MSATIRDHNLKSAAMWSGGGRAYDEISRSIANGIDHCVTRLNPAHGERVADIATGTGWTSRELARRGADVVAFDQKLAEQVPLDLSFRDERGNEVRLSDYFGRKPVIVNFVYYKCRDLCPLLLDGLVRSLRALSFEIGNQFAVLTVSFDPHDSAALADAKNKEFLARYAVSCAGEFDTPVVSGLAHGIDRIVHEWCLRIGLPTISVLGTGILNTYPVRHTGLGNEIVENGGLLLSEYFPDQGPSAQNFVWRNRLQAALGCIVIPAEWARKSGTAHTVRFAQKFKHQVFSLSATGVLRKPDAGEGDLHFDLPHDHTRFVDAMASVINAISVSTPAAQTDLFSNTR